MTSTTGPQGVLSYLYDAAGRRTRITYPTSGGSSLYVTTVYDVVGNVTAIRENGATCGIGVLASLCARSRSATPDLDPNALTAEGAALHRNPL